MITEPVSELGSVRRRQTRAPLSAVAEVSDAPASASAPVEPIVLPVEKVKEPEAKEPEPFLLNAVAPDDARLGPTLADWPRYMTLAAQIEIVDLTDSAVRYPSIEAAIASAKFQKATNMPALGPQLFRVEGAIHQSYVRKREGMAADALPKSIEDEATAVRVASGQNKMKAYKAVWDPDAWSAQKMELYKAYLDQRFSTDPRFREMVQAIQAKGGEIMFVNGTDANELGIGVRKDGSIAGGENKIGRLIQDLV